ncbi:protein kintoun-like [Babylonia areolata]|uniref:protein kintoun-like n=1 Tax=Babylonia areolata TaxID=304850 RepID=UPI003FD12419
MASSSKLEDLNISQDEIQRIKEALKDEKFRKMFCEYAEEISDPENRRRYEEEIAQMERERGMDITFIRPEPGHVLKTSVDGDKKAFINISKSDKIDKPNSERKTGADGKTGLMWHIPHSFAPPREDYDKQKKTCQVFDFVIHPDTYRMAENNARFKKMVEDTALDGIEKQFGVCLDRKNIKKPKMQFKGVPSATVVRNRSSAGPQPSPDSSGILKDMPYPYDNKTTQEKMKEREELAKKNVNKDREKKAGNKTEGNKDDATHPKYTIVHRSQFDMQEYRNAPDAKTSTRPCELVIKIELPLLKSAAQANLDIFEKRLVLESSAPAAYRLDLPLPFPVDEANGSAKFDKQKRTLTVTLPVIPDTSSALSGEGKSVVLPEEEERKSEKPLVEVLSESKSEASPLPQHNHENGFIDSESITNGVVDHDYSSVDNKTFSPTVAYGLPEYTFTQDTETITFVLKVRNVAEDSVKNTSSDTEVSLMCTSQGEGGFPLHFSLFLRFADGCQIAPEHCNIDITAENIALLLLKERKCRGLWDYFLAGKDAVSLEKKLFLTTNNLQEQLMELDNAAATMDAGTTKTFTDPAETVNGTDGPACDLQVTAMGEKKLTIKITQAKSSGGRRWKEEEEDDEYDPPSSADIEVIHTQPSPTLHSILKQRTMSESSEDVNLDPESPRSPVDDEDDLSPNASGKRRSVSFSKHIDKATFKSSASVNSMKTALKSKRKRQRKWEEKKDKASSRRRHNSTGSEGSGDDHCHSQSDSHSHSDEELLDEESKGSLGGTSGKQEMVLDDRTNTSEDKPDVSENCHSSTGSMNVAENLDPYSACEALDSSSQTERESVDKSREEEGAGGDVVDNTGSHSEGSGVDVKCLRDPDVNSQGSNVKVCPASPNSDQGSSGNEKNLADKIKSKLAEERPGDRPEDSDDEDEDKASDKSSVCKASYNEHRTECAFTFSNDLMFDLDVD